MNAENIKSDTLTILISNQYHKFLNNKDRAIKISKTCKIVRDRTKDKVLYNACRSIINSTSRGQYSYVIDTITKTENNYLNEYK